LPTALFAKDLPGGQTQILNLRRIRPINGHPVECDAGSPPEHTSVTEDWLNRFGDLHSSDDSEHDCAADVESDIEQDNRIEDPQCPGHRQVSAAPNLLGLIRAPQTTRRQTEKVLVMVNAMETWRNKGVTT
jgi:hypothetical protein